MDSHGSDCYLLEVVVLHSSTRVEVMIAKSNLVDVTSIQSGGSWLACLAIFYMSRRLEMLLVILLVNAPLGIPDMANPPSFRVN